MGLSTHNKTWIIYKSIKKTKETKGLIVREGRRAGDRERINNKFFCHKFNIKCASEDYNNLHIEIGLEKLKDRQKNHDMVFLHKLMNNEIDFPHPLEKMTIRIPPFCQEAMTFLHSIF